MRPTSESLNNHCPEILRWHTAQHRIEALRNRGNVIVSDSIRTQLRDLVRTRHPSKRLTTAEQEDLTASELNDMPSDQYGVWVYYGWSRRLVHLLDEREFVEVRTNRNCYKITPAEQQMLST